MPRHQVATLILSAAAVSHAFVQTSPPARPPSLVARDSLAAPWRSACFKSAATKVEDQGERDTATNEKKERKEGKADEVKMTAKEMQDALIRESSAGLSGSAGLIGSSDGQSWGAELPTIPSLKQYRRLRSKRREARLDRTPHDEVIVRVRRGRLNAIPQAQRYRSSDWLAILRNTPDSVVLKRIREPIMFNMLWSGLFAFLQQRFQFLPEMAAVQPHALIGSALGLLLVFRTNAAYNRFWEGRQIWEKVHSQSRAIARFCMLYRDEIGKSKVRRIANLVCVYSCMLHDHVTGGEKWSKKVMHLLEREDKKALERVGNRPVCILNNLGREMKAIPDQTKGDQILFSSRERLAVLGMVEKLSELIGACERLVQTPVPLNYARHTSRFLTIWCLMLPIALVGEIGYAVVPISGMICWGLFGIQEIGLMIEEPFRRTLPIEVITDAIYADVHETIYMNDWWEKSTAESKEKKEKKKEEKKKKELSVKAAAEGKALAEDMTVSKAAVDSTARKLAVDPTMPKAAVESKAEPPGS